MPAIAGPARRMTVGETPAMPPATALQQGTPLQRAGGRVAAEEAEIKRLMREAHDETTENGEGRIVGPLRPCTLINFNPIPLVSSKPLQLTIPSCNYATRNKFEIEFRGRIFQGAYSVLRSGRLRRRVTGFKETTDPIYQTRSDTPTEVFSIFSPHEMGFELYEKFTSLAYKPVGGVLLFDQDIHELERIAADPERPLLVPERTQEQLNGPYRFSMRRTTLDEELQRIFTQQENYFNARMNEAHNWMTSLDEDTRRLITDTHRTWAAWGFDMGYLTELPKYVSEKLSLTSSVKDRVACPQCGTQRLNEHSYFCANLNCNAPYDALAAYKARKVVPQAYLEMLPADQYEEYLAIEAEREAEREEVRAKRGVGSSAAVKRSERSSNKGQQ